MEIFKKIWSYLTLRQQTGKGNKYLGMMHNINRISLFMGIIALLILLFRYC